MYIKREFEETRLQYLHQLIRDYPLSTFIAMGDDSTFEVNHIPLHLVHTGEGFGLLQGHIARANPLTKLLAADVDVLAIFHGPQAYITPSWYESKISDGKVVPTWDFAVVHTFGTARLIEDPMWLRTHLESMTAESEEKYFSDWRLSDAPEQFIERMLAVIVGIEIVVNRYYGKWKVSQNQPQINQKSVIAGLRSKGLHDMASLVSNYIT
ncbi:FMN-binding negative transcriptional regulator [Acidithiobacillus sp. AMEEHan]|uniref:FMN-binding negative transcriptional regulator n=1 Tax=Acidithiobacillus sp. AMEEHan TaxID=2994951 RepID=UPI0027E3EDD3|nr:FMN-binding negative transcriptional regulator [Acidithiobacillus sp. AMEEHan]